MKKKLFKLDLGEFATLQNTKPKEAIQAPGFVPSTNKKGEIADAFNFIELIKVWPEIVGNKIAEHTIPLKNTYNTLVILSNHSVFAQELSFMEVELRRKILVKFPKLSQSIKQLKFIVDSEYFQTQKKFQETTVDKKSKFVAPHPFSPEYKKLKNDAEMMMQEIDDPDLKKDLISLYFQTMAKNQN